MLQDMLYMLVAGKGRKPEMLLSPPTISSTVSRLDPERRPLGLGVISTMEDGTWVGTPGRREESCYSSQTARARLAKVNHGGAPSWLVLGCDKNISHLMRAWFFVKLGENETRGI